MSRRAWVIVAGLLAFVVLSGVFAAGGYFWYQHSRMTEWKQLADSYFAKGNWPRARSNYGLYLSKARSDKQALLNRAEASSHILDNREEALDIAANAYQVYLQYYPGDKSVQEKLLALYEQARSWADIQYLTEVLLKDQPDDPLLLYYRALALDRSGAKDTAASAYRALLQQPSPRTEVYGNLARLLLSQGRRSEAEDTIAKAIAAHPEDPLVRLMAARYYAETSATDNYRHELGEAVRLKPDNAEVLLAQAVDAFQTKDIPTAISFAEKARAADPKSPRIAFTLARAYASADQTTNAIETLRNLDPTVRVDNPEILVLQADLLYSQSKLVEAGTVADEYAAAYPRQQTIIDYFKGRDMLARGDPAGAREILTRVVEKGPDFSPARFFLAVAYLQCGTPADRAAASSNLRAYLQKNPGDRNAQALQKREFDPPSPEQARDAAEALLQRDNAKAQDLVDASRALINSTQDWGGSEKDRIDTLRQVLESAIHRDPKLVEAYRVLAEILLVAGDVSAARQTLDQAKAAGIPEHLILKTEASVALAEGKPDLARAHFDAALVRSDAAMRIAYEWVDLFAVKGQRKLSDYVLTKARERFASDPEAGPGLTLKAAELSAVYDPPAAALKRIQQAQSQLQDRPESLSRLAGARLEVARRLLLEGGQDNTDQARGIVSKMLEQYPEQPTAKALKAQMLLGQVPPDYSEARRLLQEVLQRDSANPVALLGLSRIASSEGNTSLALRYAEQAAKAAPRSSAIILQRARLLASSKRHLEAQAALDQLLEIEPNNGVALGLYVESCLASDRIPQAEEYLRRLEKIAKPNSSDASALASLRAQLLVKQGTPTEAATLLRQQLDANPNDMALLQSYANTLVSQGQSQQAEVLLKEYAEKHKGEARAAEALVILAKLYSAEPNPRLAEASDALTRALLIDPSQLQVTREMIRLQARKGDAVEALNWCERYLDQSPNDPEVLFQKALLLANQPGKLVQALASVDKAIGMSDQYDYKALRGQINVDLKDYSKALEDLQPLASNGKSTTAQVDLVLAEAYLGTGKRDLAKRYYESARKKVGEGQWVDSRRDTAVSERMKTEEGPV